MALARVKTYWTKMEATAIATRGPPGGQDSPEHYFEEVLEGAMKMRVLLRPFGVRSALEGTAEFD